MLLAQRVERIQSRDPLATSEYQGQVAANVSTQEAAHVRHF